MHLPTSLWPAIQGGCFLLRLNQLVPQEGHLGLQRATLLPQLQQLSLYRPLCTCSALVTTPHPTPIGALNSRALSWLWGITVATMNRRAVKVLVMWLLCLAAADTGAKCCGFKLS
jgi:hypothetical protein